MKSRRVAQAAEVAGDLEEAAVASMTAADPGVSDGMEPAAASDRPANAQEASAAVEVGAVVASDRPVIEATDRAQAAEVSTEAAPVAISLREADPATDQVDLAADAPMTDQGPHKAADSKHKSFLSVFI